MTTTAGPRHPKTGRRSRHRTVDGVQLHRDGVVWVTPDGRWHFWLDEGIGKWWLVDQREPFPEELVGTLKRGIVWLRRHGHAPEGTWR